jgi:hypothetical protein
MPARLLPLLALSLAAVAQAAPAPFPKTQRGPEYAPVLLRGFLLQDKVPLGDCSAIGNQADYRALARAWGIAQPPRVDFRIHFLAVHVCAPLVHVVRFEADDRGDLRAVTQSTAHMYGFEPAGHRFLIRSFPRSAVKTVNGLPLPKP